MPTGDMWGDVPPNPRDAQPGRGTPLSWRDRRRANRRLQAWQQQGSPPLPGPPGAAPLSGWIAPGYPPPGSTWTPSGYPPPGPTSWYPSPRPRTSGLAIAAFVLSLVWLAWLGSLLGVIFGLIALREIRRSGGWVRGKGLAISGVIIGSLGLAGLVAAAAIGVPSPRAGPSAIYVPPVGHVVSPTNPPSHGTPSTTPSTAPRAKDPRTTTAPPATTVPPTPRPTAPPPASPPAPPPQITVAASGFTQIKGFSTASEITYGVILQDRSSYPAINVRLSVVFKDTFGRAVATDTKTITGIPAGGRFYVAGLLESNVTLQTLTSSMTATASSTTTGSFVLPTAFGTTIKPNPQAPGFGAILGNFNNPYRQPMSQDNTTIYVVYVNSSGAVIGGTLEQAGASVQPGATVSYSVPVARLSNVAAVDASVDPCSYLGVPLLSFQSCLATPRS
jgi:Domain of unknown function (DUF4190)